MDQIVSRLDSGILMAYKHIVSPVAYCALSIRTGTRDEESKRFGIAHFTEHMLFKGTKKRGALAINGYLERLGGELNAYTTKEETVVHATVLKEDLGKAIELLSELVFDATFPENEAEKERGVILEEISSYKDSPSDLIFEDFDEFIFDEHPLSIPILGYPATVKKIKAVHLKEFRDKFYTLPNVSLSIVSETPYEKVCKLADRYIRPYNSGLYPVPPVRFADIVLTAAAEEKIIARKTFQGHCITGNFSYSYYDDRRYAAALVTNILGGPALNSRLNTVLRERHALAYTVEASNSSYIDAGLFSIYFGSDKANIQRCLSLIRKELDSISEKGLSEQALKAAKKQLLGQLAIASDNAESQCLNMGKSLLVFGKVDTIEEIRSRIEAITSKDIVETATEMFNPAKMKTLIYR
jgi:predicted Zn-dependent peptidase